MSQNLAAFGDLELTEPIVRALHKMGIENPTPVQQLAIPPMLDGQDIIARAPTGTGKTCAFGIPLLECLDLNSREVQAVILCPTRELCVQIAEELRALSACIPQARIAAIYGGQPIQKQIAALQKHPHIVVATPGRLLDHMGRGTVSLDTVYTAVLDEADEMLKMGFVRDVRRILNATPSDTQVVLFSATMSREVMDVAWEYQHNAVEIAVAAEGDNRPQIAQYSLSLDAAEERLQTVLQLIDCLQLKRVMIFANTKATVRWLDQRLKRAGRSADTLHGDIPQSQRNQVMDGFRRGKFEILTATDVAARGIDVDDVEAVFNYDVPDENEYYLHRIGRTGRAKRHGMAFTFVTMRDGFRMKEIQRYCRADITPLKKTADGQFTTADGTVVFEK